MEKVTLFSGEFTDYVEPCSKTFMMSIVWLGPVEMPVGPPLVLVTNHLHLKAEAGGPGTDNTAQAEQLGMNLMHVGSPYFPCSARAEVDSVFPTAKP